MAENARLQIVLRLKDEASKRMKNIDKSFKQSAKRIGTSAAAGGLVAGAAFVASGKKAQEWGDSVKEAETALKMGTGAMGDDLASLMDSTADVSGQVPQDFGTVAQAVADVNTEFGLMGDPLEETTKMFLDVARVAKMEAGPMIKGVSDIMEVYGVDQAEANRILGDFITVAQDTGQPLSKVISDMQTYGPVLKTAGMETAEAAAFLGVLNSQGIDTGRIMPAINKRVRDLAEGGVTDLHAALMADIEALSNMEEGTYQIDRATKVFGSEGAVRMLAAINAGLIPASEELTLKLQATTDEITNLTDDSMTTSEEFSVLKNKMMAFFTPFADYIAMIGAILVPLGLLALAFGGVALAAGVLGTTMMPIIVAILAVVAAVTIAVVIFKNWDKIVGVLGATWDTVWSAMKTVFNTVMSALETVFNSKFGWLLPGGTLLLALNLLRDNWDAIWNGMKSVVAAVATPIISIINSMIGAINGLFGVLNNISIGWEKKVLRGMPDIPGFGPWSPFNIKPIPKIPAMAQGGIVTKPTIAQIGEAGPEAIVPLRAGAGMGTTVIINFPQGSTVILDNEASARSLADQITQQIRGVLRAQGTF